MGCTQTRNVRAQPTKVSQSNDQKAKIKNNYLIVPKILGRGRMSTVYSASPKNNPESRVAIKVLNKVQNKDNMKNIWNEIDTLKNLNHPNIVKYIEHYENEYNVYIVLEHCTKGSLSSAIKRKVKNNHWFYEYEARETVQKIFEAMIYCHSKNIVHGNLDPSNIMFDQQQNLKIIDFGSLDYISEKEGNSVPTYQSFKAPEIIKGSHATKEADVWSVGVILYVMLIGRYPFLDDNYTFNDRLWEEVSECAKNLIISMLRTNPSKRYTFNECLEHKWTCENMGEKSLDVDFFGSEMGESVSSGTSLPITIMVGDGYKRHASESLLFINNGLEEVTTNKSSKIVSDHESDTHITKLNKIKPEWMQKIEEEVNGIDESISEWKPLFLGNLATHRTKIQDKETIDV